MHIFCINNIFLWQIIPISKYRLFISQKICNNCIIRQNIEFSNSISSWKMKSSVGSRLSQSHVHDYRFSAFHYKIRAHKKIQNKYPVNTRFKQTFEASNAEVAQMITGWKCVSFFTSDMPVKKMPNMATNCPTNHHSMPFLASFLPRWLLPAPCGDSSQRGHGWANWIHKMRTFMCLFIKGSRSS